MFLESANALLYLKAQSLDVYIKGTDEVGEISFPAVVIKHLEIVDETKLNELIISFIARSGLENQSAVLLLSDEVTFHKNINRDTPETEKALIEAFFDKVPLEKSHQAKKVLVSENALIAVATNRSLYESIINSFSSNNWKIKSVTPAIVFGQLSNHLDAQLVEDILKADDILQKDNLLDLESLEKDESLKDESTSSEMAKKTSNKTLLLIIIFIFLLILSAGGYAAYKFGYLTRLMDRINPTTVTKTDPTPSGNPNQPDSNVIITPQATESAQEESSSSGVLNKQTLKIQVLNGSDVAGQAAKAKEALINLGYTDIETGNSPESTASSHIEFSENVSSVNRILIIDDFKKIVSNLEELTSNSTESDVVLTLGQDYQ